MNASIDEPIETRRIYHGKKTRVRSYPFLASLHQASEFLCAGSIISVDLIITAASCLQMLYKKEVFLSKPQTIFARVGSDCPKRSGKLVPIVAVVFHPKYDPVTLRNNLAIVKMLKKVKHTKEIKRIKYDKEAGILKQTIGEIKILGWGARYEKDKKIGVQRPSVAHLDIYDINDCKEIYSKYYVSETNFCAGFTSKGGGACTGDVGGPAVVSKKLVGVVSFGPTVCGMLDAPTVFTKVGYYADWIDEVIHKSRTNHSKLSHITVNSTKLPQFLDNPVFTGTNTTKKKLKPIYDDKSQSNQSQQLVSIVNLPTNKDQIYPHLEQSNIFEGIHKMSVSQKPGILMKHQSNQGQKLLSQAKPQMNQGNKPQVSSPLRQRPNPPSYKNLQNYQRQKPLSYGISQLNPKQIPIAPEKSPANQNFKPMTKLNPRYGKKHFLRNIKPEIKHTMKNFTDKNLNSKQDLIPVYVNQRHYSKHFTESILDNDNKDELSIIQQVIQDMILDNETVIDYLTDEKKFDGFSEFVENISRNFDGELSDLEKSKLNENIDTANQTIMKQNMREAKLHPTPSNLINTYLPISLSYYDGKLTQKATFIQSLEISKEDISSYYEVEIPIEATPFTRSPSGLDDDNENDEYMNHNQDTTTISRMSNTIYGTKINDGSNKNIPDNNIYHKAIDEEDHVAFENRQNNKKLSRTTAFKDSFNIYHKDTDSDREIPKIKIKNENRDLNSMTEMIEKREKSITRKNENRNLISTTKRNENRDSRSVTERNKNRDSRSMTERNKNRNSGSMIGRYVNRERSLTERNENKDSRNTTKRNENRNSKSMSERNENRDTRSMTERNEDRAQRSMKQRNENRDSRSLNERNERKTTKESRYETRIEALYKDDSLQLEREINLDVVGGVAEVISQEDFNYAHYEEKGIEMRSRKGDQYYDFNFMTDYNY